MVLVFHLSSLEQSKVSGAVPDRRGEGKGFHPQPAPEQVWNYAVNLGRLETGVGRRVLNKSPHRGNRHFLKSWALGGEGVLADNWEHKPA